MKKFVSLALVCLFLLCSCTNIPTVVPVGSAENGLERFINPKTGVEYMLCNDAVEAITVGDIYCRYDSSTTFSAIKYEEPTRFLRDTDENLGYVYCEKSIGGINMKNFNPVAGYLTVEGEVSLNAGWLYCENKYWSDEDWSKYDAGMVTAYDDSAVVYAIRDTINTQASVDVYPYLDFVNVDYTVHIHLLSADFPGIEYNVIFYRDNDGNNYLFDKGTKLSYYCPASVVERLWEDA